MIQVEAAQVVLVRLPLSTVLAYDETRYRFEDFAGAHERTLVQLRGRDGTLTCRFRDADEVRCRVLYVGDVAKCLGARHDDVRAERQRQHDVRVDSGSGRDAGGPSQDAEVQEAERQLGTARWHRVESVGSVVVRHRCQLA